MQLLVCLAARAGEVVTIEELLNQVWPDVVVTAGFCLSGCHIAAASAR